MAFKEGTESVATFAMYLKESIYSSKERFVSLLKSVTHQINAMAVLNSNVNFCDSHSGIVTNVAA